ncbi:hypothetical protein [Hoyosella altamirensis]|uniref:NRPS condensation-like uncharacterized protein n=1 Tax=Hoyosella altamirensis TaxID=616997 RepID=A0A839RHK4_9ACTN|nr:hypothetical protein [Hoyosella altamirensis]MBB3035900.1 NRPS condensation-like uncharacterized protein [Hoyosella altamirensis]
MRTLPVTSLDEAFINLGSKTPMSVEFEVKVSGRLDIDCLTRALRAAALTHPLARAKLAPAAIGSRTLTWVIPDSADYLSVEVTDEPSRIVRARLQSVAPNLYQSPSFHVALVREDDGDRLMFNLHHATFDGMGGIRFLISVAREYAGTQDPAGGPDIMQARDLKKLFGSRRLSDLTPRVAKVAGDLPNRRRITKVTPDGGSADGGYVLSQLRLTADEVAIAAGRRPRGATINDLVIAAHALTIIRWNSEHAGELGDTVSVMMPVNLRPAEWSSEVVSNFASYLTVFVPTTANDLTEATGLVRDETTTLKQNGAANWIVDVLEPGNLLPNVLKRSLTSLLPLVEKQFVETTTLSNLGRQAVPAFGDAGEVRELWFSPPLVSQTIPVSVGVAGHNRELFFGFRGGGAAMSQDALDRFALMYRETLVGHSA